MAQTIPKEVPEKSAWSAEWAGSLDPGARFGRQEVASWADARGISKQAQVAQQLALGHQFRETEARLKLRPR